MEFGSLVMTIEKELSRTRKAQMAAEAAMDQRITALAETAAWQRLGRKRRMLEAELRNALTEWRKEGKK